MFYRPSIREVNKALAALVDIPRPDTDNEGDPINGRSVLPYLSHENAQRVRHAEELLYKYTRNWDGQPDRRALNTLGRHGYDASLDTAQYEPDKLAGSVRAGDWYIDISDELSIGEDD